jgi:hypothetical protein
MNIKRRILEGVDLETTEQKRARLYDLLHEVYHTPARMMIDPILAQRIEDALRYDKREAGGDV